MKILVTGANGTIGTRLCEFLIKAQYEVIGIDRKENVFKDKSEVSFVKIIDLLDKEELLKEFNNIKDIDLCIHLAANPYVRKSVENPDLAFENVVTTYNILELCRKLGIPKVFLASSREVYGNQFKIKKVEEDVNLDGCESPYTASKFYLEAMGQAYRNSYGMHTTILRFSNVYGMYDDSDRLIPTLIHNIMQDKDIEIYGENKSLDFTYIDDTISAIMELIESNYKSGEVFNIASGKQTSLIMVAELLKNIMCKKNIQVRITQSYPGEVLQYIADISKLQQNTLYLPKFDIVRGLSRTIDFYLKYFGDKK